MTSRDAILSLFARWLDFSGRSSRAEFGWGMALVLGASFVATSLDRALGIAVLDTAVSLVTVVPQLSLQVRRLHDTGRSGWWLVTPAVPMLVYKASLWLGQALGDEPGPRPVLSGIAFAASVALLAVLLAMCLSKGDRGPNAHGPDPRDGDGRRG